MLKSLQWIDLPSFITKVNSKRIGTIPNLRVEPVEAVSRNTLAPIRFFLHPKIFSVLLFLSALGLSAQQSHPYFQSYTTEDGLGGEAINDILVDRFGYVWTGAYSGLHRYDGYEFVNYPADLLDQCALSHQIVHALLEDGNGDLWVGTSGGLNRLNRTTGCFQRFFHSPLDTSSLPGNEIVDLTLGPRGEVIVQTKSGIGIFDHTSQTFRQLSALTKQWNKLVNYQGQLWAGGAKGISKPLDPESKIIPFPAGQNLQIQAMLPHADSLLLGTSAGVYYWTKGDTVLHSAFLPDNGVNGLSIMDIIPANIHGVQGHWMTTCGEGFGWVSIKTGDQAGYEAGKPKAYSLLDNHVRALAYDKNGSLWIGTYVGLNRLNLGNVQPSYYRSTFNEDLGDQVLELHATPDGRIFSYVRWRGLFKSDRIGFRERLVDYPVNDFLLEKNLNYCFTDRQGTTWLLRGFDQMYQLTKDTPDPTPFTIDFDLSEVQTIGMAQDFEDDDTYWLATDKGLGRLTRSTRQLKWWQPTEQAPNLVGDVLTVVLPTVDGKVWLSAGNYYSDYLGYFDTATETFTFLPYEVGNPEKIAGGRIKQLAKSPDGNIWAAASQGLISIDPTLNTARLITQVKDVRVGGVESVLTDGNGNIWFTGNDQISCYLPAEERIQKFTCPPIGQFANAVGTTLPDGRLLFGGQGGLVAVDPDRILHRRKDFPRLVFNNVTVNGNPYQPDQPLAELTSLKLGPGERALTLRFAGLFFDRNQHIEYAYRLNNSDWQELGKERSLSFADLNPGAYQLELRASDGQGSWNPNPHLLAITVAPYWYETQIAWLSFLALGLLTLVLLGRLFLRRKLERQTLHQLQELDAFKSRFLTNLTHEFRTPLTLILGPARRLRELARTSQNSTLEREARRIDRQGRRLLDLINQLLDLRKLEAGQLEVERTPVHLEHFLSELTEGFLLEAESKNITLNFNTEGADAGAVEVDKSKVDSIVTNLVANALKYTPEGGTVSITQSTMEQTWKLAVQDSGPGIPPDLKDRIFERFARAPGETVSGTGVGLALARELAQLLGGKLTVEDSAQPGALFHLSLPLHYTTAEIPIMPKTQVPPIQHQPTTAVKKQAPLILIVEDDPGVRAFLEESLSVTYRVLTAPNGQDGLEIAIREIPDLVVSDVMMPVLDGLQLCARLKNDRRTSHLPVLLLTAKTAIEHRLEGLDRGADAYLNKPFAERELHLRLRNLLALRDNTATKLREQLLQSGNQAPPDLQEIHQPVSAFIEDLHTLIIKRLDDPTLSVSDLEKGLGLSRSQRHRKLTATLGISSNKLINQLRLEAAAERLSNSNLPVSAIAYDCGFRDVGYFGKRFRERYGKSPSGYRKLPFREL